MRTLGLAVCVALAAMASAVPAAAATLRCPKDSVKVGDTCVDTYEASVWQVPDPTGAGKSLVKRILQGKVLRGDLTTAGAVQLGCPIPPFDHSAFPGAFPVEGDWTPLAGTNPPTPGVYAVSIAGVLPSACVSQLQAIQACRLVGKHLIRNEEWQSAAAGTPDPGSADDGTTTCATNSANPARTGARTACASVWGAHDMVGNVWEWVADWSNRAPEGTGTDWQASAGVTDGDRSAFGGNAGTTVLQLPGVPARGGGWASSLGAGALAVDTTFPPSGLTPFVGFRCAR